MKNLGIAVIVAVLGISFSACEKTTDETTKTVAVTVTSPSSGHTMHSGHNLNVDVTFTDPTELHNYTLVVTNKTDSTEALNIMGHNHSTSFNIDTTIAINVSAHSDFELKATATNHSGEMASKTVNFHVHP